jgi:site-specific recombinase XerD
VPFDLTHVYLTCSPNPHKAEYDSTLLHALGVDLKAQQELLRHADIRTTMNIYTQAIPCALREANSKVVRLVIPAQVP